MGDYSTRMVVWPPSVTFLHTTRWELEEPESASCELASAPRPTTEHNNIGAAVSWLCSFGPAAPSAALHPEAYIYPTTA